MGTLADYKMTCLKGGRHHSIGVTADGELLTWGRFDTGQIGIEEENLIVSDAMRDDKGNIRLATPQIIQGMFWPLIVFATCR